SVSLIQVFLRLFRLDNNNGNTADEYEIVGEVRLPVTPLADGEAADVLFGEDLVRRDAKTEWFFGHQKRINKLLLYVALVLESTQVRPIKLHLHLVHGSLSLSAALSIAHGPQDVPFVCQGFDSPCRAFAALH